MVVPRFIQIISLLSNALTNVSKTDEHGQLPVDIQVITEIDRVTVDQKTTAKH